MAFNQFVQFMKSDLEGKSSSMCSFLSKRAKLMIAFSIELLGEYLKILKRPGVEENVDVNAFLDDIALNLEEFKDKERHIRERHFNYFEESQIIDSQLMKSEIFAPTDISQIHSVRATHQVLKLFLDKTFQVELSEDGNKIEISKAEQELSRSKATPKGPKTRDPQDREFDSKRKDSKPSSQQKPENGNGSKAKPQDPSQKSRLEESDYIRNNIFDVHELEDSKQSPEPKKITPQKNPYKELDEARQSKPAEKSKPAPASQGKKPSTVPVEPEEALKPAAPKQAPQKETPSEAEPKKPDPAKQREALQKSSPGTYQSEPQDRSRDEAEEPQYYSRKKAEDKPVWPGSLRQSGQKKEDDRLFGSMVDQDDRKFPVDEDEQYFREPRQNPPVQKQSQSQAPVDAAKRTPEPQGWQASRQKEPKAPATKPFDLEARKSVAEPAHEREPVYDDELPTLHSNAEKRRHGTEPHNSSYSARRAADREDSPRNASVAKSTRSANSSKPMIIHGSYKDGFHKIKFENGVYEGEIRDNKRNGQGRYAWNDGNSYDGQWADDRKEGRGKFVWDSGDAYEGDYYNDKRDGQGTKTYANGDLYEVGPGHPG